MKAFLNMSARAVVLAALVGVGGCAGASDGVGEEGEGEGEGEGEAPGTPNMVLDLDVAPTSTSCSYDLSGALVGEQINTLVRLFYGNGVDDAERQGVSRATPAAPVDGVCAAFNVGSQFFFADGADTAAAVAGDGTFLCEGSSRCVYLPLNDLAPPTTALTFMQPSRTLCFVAGASIFAKTPAGAETELEQIGSNVYRGIGSFPPGTEIQARTPSGNIQRLPDAVREEAAHTIVGCSSHGFTNNDLNVYVDRCTTAGGSAQLSCGGSTDGVVSAELVD